jgi:hypothetical protein
VSAPTKTHHRCPRCGETKPRTTEHFSFDAQGRVSGYCRPCQRAYCAAHWAAGRVVRPPHYTRDYMRRRYAIPPERWRQREEEASC